MHQTDADFQHATSAMRKSRLPELLSDRLLGFGQVLAQNGIRVDAGSLVESHQIAAADYILDRCSFRFALKSCFCKNRRDWQLFDNLFDVYWSASSASNDGNEQEPATEPPSSIVNAPALASDDGKLVGFAGTSSQEVDTTLTGAGDFKALSLADFRFVSDPAQIQAIEQMIDELARRSRRQRMRRKLPCQRGSVIDMRRSLARAPRYDGLIAELRYQRRPRRLPRFVLLLDVSQSMEVYAKLFLRFALKLVNVFQRSDIFAFNTQLIALGSGHHALSESSFEDKLTAESRSWLGGTRIASSLREFNHDHAASLSGSQTTVIIFSDGCDTDKPHVLAKEVEKVQSRCRRLIWVNPLLGRFSDGEKDPYMDPIRPYIDRYRSAHNLDSLIALQKDLLY